MNKDICVCNLDEVYTLNSASISIYWAAYVPSLYWMLLPAFSHLIIANTWRLRLHYYIHFTGLKKEEKDLSGISQNVKGRVESWTKFWFSFLQIPWLAHYGVSSTYWIPTSLLFLVYTYYFISSAKQLWIVGKSIVIEGVGSEWLHNVPP